MAMLKLMVMMIIVDHRCTTLLRQDHRGANVEDGDHGDEVKDPKLENVMMEVLQ